MSVEKYHAGQLIDRGRKVSQTTCISCDKRKRRKENLTDGYISIISINIYPVDKLCYTVVKLYT